jgi:hypothetical protein
MPERPVLYGPRSRFTQLQNPHEPLKLVDFSENEDITLFSKGILWVNFDKEFSKTMDLGILLILRNRLGFSQSRIAF